ncbi:MAG: hypothetical protein H7A46_09045 [Verrucomicrobiales bacterium]|nr:hypothetical protein [Verrucomicrobiales bacterium]
MKPASRTGVVGRANPRASHGLTLMELLAVLFCLSVLVGICLSTLSGSCKSLGPRCLGNLRNATLAAILFSQDHQDRFPDEVPVGEGGSLGLGWDAWLHFRTLSNQWMKPRDLVCPTESKGRLGSVASNWTGPRSGTLSYFINVDASAREPRGILFGDRHLAANGGALQPGLALIHSNSVLHWTRELHQRPLTNFTYGNLAFSDGHTEGFQSPDLIRGFLHGLPKPTRLLMPQSGVGNRGGR